MLAENIMINNAIVCFKLDTGAECNVLPTKVYCTKIGSLDGIAPANVNLMAFGRKMVQVRGLMKIIDYSEGIGNTLYIEIFQVILTLMKTIVTVIIMQILIVIKFHLIV
ncbi:uncharacterized protein LOC123317423 [Coccinella septempunctata]|uniref:uncharacterized protein LOC123317423 n=1 Tax=Coccinella septempunctata TaxID=41139 RepID=UPI001D06DA66|nr:uncharacterized protein LOC123317423 [Coccinella septempunctata]